VTNVRLQGTEITGNWSKKSSEFYGERSSTLAQRFANWPCDPESILQFTQRWGPLFGNPYDRDRGFRFTIEEWIEAQSVFRAIWRNLKGFPRDFEGIDRRLPIGTLPIATPEPVQVQIGPKAVILQIPNLFTFMHFELHSSIKVLRICKRRDCKKRYFLAQHGKEQYCSTDCANWAQSVWKKRWHEEQRQKGKKGGGSDGTQKTR
jgi:hypothetical protein